MISDNIFLLRFRGSDPGGVLDYWSMINDFGQILPIPEKAKKYLVWSNFATGLSKMTEFLTNVVLCGGHERVISFGAEMAKVEKHIIKI